MSKNLKQRLDSELMQRGTTLDVELALKHNSESQLLQMVREISLTGFQAIGRRPKYHLAANLLWLIDFQWRKMDRRYEYFLGDRATSNDANKLAEAEYEEVLDIIKASFLKNYEESDLALDVLNLGASQESDFEKHMRLKAEETEKRLAEAQEIIEEEQRKRRNDPKTFNI